VLIGGKIVHKQRSALVKPAQQGVVLLEVMIAILIFSMGVLAIVGLQAVMVKNTADSKYRADASYIAQQAIGRMWSDPANAASYVETNTDISSLLPDGKRTVAQTGPNQFTVTITWQQPGAGEVQHNFTTTAQIAGG
jgi:type IV pilus assembly protein PilV